MLKPIEMDENVTLAVQLEEEEGGRPVILINKFNVKPEDLDQLLNAWAVDGSLPKAEARVHLFTASSGHWRKLRVYQLCSMGVCEAHFKQATSDPAFRSALAPYPDSTPWHHPIFL